MTDGRPYDPFPMQSEEARNLEASVQPPPSSAEPDDGGGESGGGGGGGGRGWHQMGTSTSVSAPSLRTSDDDAEEGGDEGSLMGGGSKKGKKKRGGQGGGSIYEQAEAEEAAAAAKASSREDRFLEAPLPGKPTLPLWADRTVDTAGRYLTYAASKLCPNLPPSELLRTLCLSSTLFFMIGGYWLLRSLKDPVLTALCGVSVIPKAKMVSVIVVLGVVSVYNHLLDSDLPKHSLFYVFGMFYFFVFTTIAILLGDADIGLANQTPDPGRILGWVSYCAIESFGSVMVSLFWSFANSNFSLESAKASYGFMVATAQVGSILGPTVVNRFAGKWGVPRIYFVGALCMLMLQLTMAAFVKLYGAEEKAKKTTVKKEKAGILEGLRLFASHRYVRGIFAISCLFMIEVTIVDYTMKVLARDHFAKLHPCEPGMSCWDPEAAGKDGTADLGMSEAATAAFTAFMGLFGQATNVLSFLLSLLGTSAVIRKLGLRLTLLLFPTLCLCVIIMVRLRPTLYVVFAAMMMLKACSYALNNPTKEILYQPTSPAVRYKAKSWIDIFGARGSKALGSVVTNAFSDSAESLVSNGSLVGMAVASYLIWNARYMGREFDAYTKSGYVVGGGGTDDDDDAGVKDGDGGAEGVEMAMQQNEGADTSCAIEEDDDLSPEEEGQGKEAGEGQEGGRDEDDEEEEDDANGAVVERV